MDVVSSRDRSICQPQVRDKNIDSTNAVARPFRFYGLWYNNSLQSHRSGLVCLKNMIFLLLENTELFFNTVGFTFGHMFEKQTAKMYIMLFQERHLGLPVMMGFTLIILFLF